MDMQTQTLEIESGQLAELAGRKMILTADVADNDAASWIDGRALAIHRLFKQEGALLIRGLIIQGSKKLERILAAVFNDEMLEYKYRTTPRTKMRGRIYTSTEYPADQTIMLHNENAYSNRWPMNIAFYCVKPAATKGATPFADSRVIYRKIPAEIRDEFERKRLLYTRNYGDIDLPWAEVFQTRDKNVVGQYCEQNGIRYEWLSDDRLRTWQINGASCFHPRTREKVWFNQAHMFHISSLDVETRESLLNVMSVEDLPKNVYYGDRSSIDAAYITEIRKVYENNMVVFPWQEGDLLLLDNMLFAHGRQPFTGERRILAGMSGAMESDDERLQAVGNGPAP
jgi:alpha-ketoglutarate-dependent taurine dioxygenase